MNYYDEEAFAADQPVVVGTCVCSRSAYGAASVSRPFSDRRIRRRAASDSLPLVVFLAPVPSLHVTERKAECAVCFDPLADPAREVVALRCATGTTCGHYLHRDCAESWRRTALASDRSCPICRTPFQELVTFPSIDNARAWFDFVDSV